MTATTALLRPLLAVLLLGATGLVAEDHGVPAPPAVFQESTAQMTERPVVASLDPGGSSVARSQSSGLLGVGDTGSPFGSWLFSERFAPQVFTGFNPEYLLSVGDRVELRIWGGFDFNGNLTIDEQGNAFLPRIGPVALLGVRNQDLNTVINAAAHQVFEQNVSLYATLASTQQVKVYVAGFIAAPGLYPGNAADSTLAFLDRSGGILPAQGSYRNVTVLRGGKEVLRFDLYEFMLQGTVRSFQFHDGDVILVPPIGPCAEVKGEVANAYRFEIPADGVPLVSVLAMAAVQPEATHVRVTRAKGIHVAVDYHPIAEVNGLEVHAGDLVEVLSDRRPAVISVRVEGEHDGASELVVPYGTRLGEVLDRLVFTDLSQPSAVMLRRRSVALRQRERLEMRLKQLEAVVLNARSRTAEEASLRQREAELVLQWVERARAVEPRGIVVLAGNRAAREMPLESGDVVVVPRQELTVMIHGEVLFPTAVLWKASWDLETYVDQAGGFSETADRSGILVMHKDGTFDRVKGDLHRGANAGTAKGGRPVAVRPPSNLIRPGDEIMVIPMIDMKSLQVTKDVSQVLYQIALSAAVVLAL